MRKVTTHTTIDAKTGESETVEYIEPTPEGEEQGSYGDTSLSWSLIAKLHAAGYDSAEEVRNASDEELLDKDGIGPKTVEQVRVSLGWRQDRS